MALKIKLCGGCLALTPPATTNYTLEEFRALEQIARWRFRGRWVETRRCAVCRGLLELDADAFAALDLRSAAERLGELELEVRRGLLRRRLIAGAVALCVVALLGWLAWRAALWLG